MSLITLREAIRAKLATDLGSLAEAHTHGGRFDGEELKRWAVRAPCVVVSLLGIPEVELEGAQPVAGLQWGCFLITKDKGQLPRDVSALALLQAVLGVVTPLETWSDADCSSATRIRADNLFSGKLDATGVAIWAVTWRQNYDLNVFDASALDDFITYDVEYTLKEGSSGAAPEAEDTVTLPTEE